jgi:hypothetical protein
MGCTARVWVPELQEFLLYSVQTGSGVHPVRTGGLFPRGEIGHDVNLTTSIWWRCQEEWSYTSTPPYVFMA